jgi:hypothetical protein
MVHSGPAPQVSVPVQTFWGQARVYLGQGHGAGASCDSRQFITGRFFLAGIPRRVVG